MAARPHEHEGSSLELDHLHTDDPVTGRVTDAARVTSPRASRAHASRTRESRRAAFSSVGLVGAALAVVVGRRRDALRRERFAERGRRPARRTRCARSAVRRRSDRPPACT